MTAKIACCKERAEDSDGSFTECEDMAHDRVQWWVRAHSNETSDSIKGREFL
jgi:hypothetical protein